MPVRTRPHPAWYVVLLFAFGISGYAVAYLIVGAPMYPPPLKASFLARPWGINPHALFGGIGLLLGAIQFHPATRRRLPLHRILGRIYVLTCLGTGLVGLYMSAYSYGGWITHLGFAGLAVALLATTVTAYLVIRRGDVVRHRQWMIRSYAMMFAAVTLRLELPLLIMLFSGFDRAYLVVAWLCWVPNLMVAEAIVRSTATASDFTRSSATPLA